MAAHASAPPKGAVACGASKKRKIKNMKEDTDIVVITNADISRIKVDSVIMTPAMKAAIDKEKFDERMRNSAIANQRKAMMVKLEEERKKKTGSLSESEKIKRELQAMYEP